MACCFPLEQQFKSLRIVRRKPRVIEGKQHVKARTQNTEIFIAKTVISIDYSAARSKHRSNTVELRSILRPCSKTEGAVISAQLRRRLVYGGGGGGGGGLSECSDRPIVDRSVRQSKHNKSKHFARAQQSL